MTHSDAFPDLPENLPGFDPDPARPLALFQAQGLDQPTPFALVNLPDGTPLWLKDESQRMGLGAFKALGAPYAVARLIAHHWAAAGRGRLSPDRMTDADVRDFAANLTFVAASAGNHGMGVAAGAEMFGARARIYLAETVPQGFDARLQARGAEVVRAGADYEASMQAALTDAAETGAILLSDSSWPDYWRIPALVMEGYTLMAEEMRTALTVAGGEQDPDWPTHVFLQAGVGGLAAALAHQIRQSWPVQPELVVVEPDRAACLAAGADAGYALEIAGPVSNMGRLDCKQASALALDVLTAARVTYQAVSDDEAAAAATQLTALGFPTTPSGAAGYAAVRRMAGGEGFRPLIIVSEGGDA